MKDILQVLRETNSSFFPFLRGHFGELLGIFLGCEMMDQWFKFTAAQTQAMGVMNIGAALGRLNVALLLFVLLTMLIRLRDMQDRGSHGPMGLWSFSMHHLKNFTLESLRVLGWVMLTLPLLIIPGLIKYNQYLLVPYIVLCDPNYQAGHVDALDESKRLMKGYVSLFIILMLVSIPAVLWASQYTELLLAHEQPLKWCLYFITASALYLYFNLLLYKLYRVRIESLKESINGSDIQ